MTLCGRVEKPENRSYGSPPQNVCGLTGLRAGLSERHCQQHRHRTTGGCRLSGRRRLMAMPLWTVRAVPAQGQTASLAGCKAWYTSVQRPRGKGAMVRVALPLRPGSCLSTASSSGQSPPAAPLTLNLGPTKTTWFLPPMPAKPVDCLLTTVPCSHPALTGYSQVKSMGCGVRHAPVWKALCH